MLVIVFEGGLKGCDTEITLPPASNVTRHCEEIWGRQGV